jgi:hypothetical protein
MAWVPNSANSPSFARATRRVVGEQDKWNLCRSSSGPGTPEAGTVLGSVGYTSGVHYFTVPVISNNIDVIVGVMPCDGEAIPYASEWSSSYLGAYNSGCLRGGLGVSLVKPPRDGYVLGDLVRHVTELDTSDNYGDHLARGLENGWYPRREFIQHSPHELDIVAVYGWDPQLKDVLLPCRKLGRVGRVHLSDVGLARFLEIYSEPWNGQMVLPPARSLSFAGYRVGIILDFDAMECRAYVYNRDGTEYSVLLGALAQGIAYYPAVSMFGFDEVGVELDTNPEDGDTPESERARRRHIQTLQQQVNQAVEMTHQSEQQAENIFQLYRALEQQNSEHERRVEEQDRFIQQQQLTIQQQQLTIQQQEHIMQEQEHNMQELLRRLDESSA